LWNVDGDACNGGDGVVGSAVVSNGEMRDGEDEAEG